MAGNTFQKSLGRREFLATGATAMALAMAPGSLLAARKPRGMGGVAVGAISYSYRDLPGSAAKVLGYLLDAGLDTVELMGDAAEEYAGAPAAPPMPPMPQMPAQPAAPAAGQGSAAGPPALPAEFMAAMKASQEAKSAWRQQASLQPFHALRRLYDKAGVSIDILKLGDPGWPDRDIDYAFKVAKVLGARGISFEASDQGARRMGEFATRHQLYASMHNHGQYADASFDVDQLLSYSKYNMLNFDVGHYVGSTGRSPVPHIEKYHDRITHLHLKDRKSPDHGGANMPWGEGDTPLAEVLRLLQARKYPISAMIEYEYPAPAGSDTLAEMRKCAAYCRSVLL